MARIKGKDGRFKSGAQAGFGNGGRSVLMMKGTPRAALRKRELREQKRDRREMLRILTRER